MQAKGEEAVVKEDKNKTKQSVLQKQSDLYSWNAIITINIVIPRMAHFLKIWRLCFSRKNYSRCQNATLKTF